MASPYASTAPAISAPPGGYPPVSPPATPPDRAQSSFLALAVGLLVVGVVAEGLYAVSPGAAYGFVILVILGYISLGARVQNVVSFFNSIGVTRG